MRDSDSRQESAGSLLEARELRKEFGGIVALQGIDFSVERHQIKAIIGPNGAGKTTVFNLVSGLYAPTGGEIWFEGRRIDDLPAHEVAARGVSRTFQSIQIFNNLTILENIMVGCHSWTRSGFFSCLVRTRRSVREERLIERSAHEFLDFVGVTKKHDSFQSGLTFHQQRLVEIARALATKPRLVLLDEPAAGLNARETVEIGELIVRIRETGVAVLLVEHDMDLVMDISDNIVVLDFGQVIAVGTPREVRSNPRVIATYLGDEVSVAD